MTGGGMSKRDPWLKAFPLAEAAKSVDAILQAWKELAARHAPGFLYDTKEPDLTLVLTDYLRNVISPRLGLLGSWGAENVGATVDPKTLKIMARHRTDIQYRWNNASTALDVVFEFKKLDHTETSRKHYYGPNGMQRFVSGPYSKRQPIALMAAILIDPYSDCVPGLRHALQLPGVSSELRIRKSEHGHTIRAPSRLFPNHAEFDTEHMRPKPLAPKHGTIHLAHLFLAFPYPNEANKKRKRRKGADSDSVETLSTLHGRKSPQRE